MLISLSFLDSQTHPTDNIINLGQWVRNDSPEHNGYYFSSALDCNPVNDTRIEISQGQFTLTRSGSAEVPLFYSLSNNTLFVSDSVFELQEHIKPPIDLDAAYQFLYSQFLPKEKTLFQNVTQVLNGQRLVFTFDSSNIVSHLTDTFSLPMDEFKGLSEQELTTGLREEIGKAHSKRLGDNNAIFLSGGLDSQVMAITLSKDLALGNSISALHFSVKNARQSELEDAKLTAKTLNLPFHAVEVDADQNVDFDEVLKMNAPYIGAISIHQLLQSASLSSNTTVFAGQDTRLHTPSLQPIDEKLLGLYRAPIFGPLVSHTAKLTLKAKNLIKNEFESKLYRQLSFFNGTDSTQKYLASRFFHITTLPFQKQTDIDKLRNNIVDDLGKVDSQNKRALFNTIALQLWRRQFIYDINYMHDTVSHHDYKVAMPFYDTKLAHYSAQLPFDLAAKITRGRAAHDANETSVNKYLLRKAYEGELDDSLVFRDKAVCLTAHMFFNGGLHEQLNDFIHASWLTNNDRANALHLPELQKLCARKHLNWLESDHWLMMTVFNALIIYNHLRRRQ